MKTFMLLVLIASSISIAAQPIPSGDNSSIGVSLFHDCQGAIRALDGSQDPMDNLAGQYCFGYMEGIANGITSFSHKMCLPELKPSTLAKIYVLFMTKNPKYLDDQKAYGAITAFIEAYPCSVD